MSAIWDQNVNLFTYFQTSILRQNLFGRVFDPEFDWKKKSSPSENLKIVIIGFDFTKTSLCFTKKA